MNRPVMTELDLLAWDRNFDRLLADLAEHKRKIAKTKAKLDRAEQTLGSYGNAMGFKA